MTVIATDGKVMAADSLEVIGGEILRRPADKLLLKDDHAFGYAGAGPMFDDAVNWYLGGRDHAGVPRVPGHDWTLLIIKPDGSLAMVESISGRESKLRPPFAIGAGGEFAMGAMMAGASPAHAVEIACQLSTACCMPVQQIERWSKEAIATARALKRAYGAHHEAGSTP